MLVRNTTFPALQLSHRKGTTLAATMNISPHQYAEVPHCSPCIKGKFGFKPPETTILMRMPLPVLCSALKECLPLYKAHGKTQSLFHVCLVHLDRQINSDINELNDREQKSMLVLHARSFQLSRSLICMQEKTRVN